MLAAFLITLIYLLPERGGGAETLIKLPVPRWNSRPDLSPTLGNILDPGPLIPWLTPMWMFGVSFFYLRNAAGWECCFESGGLAPTKRPINGSAACNISLSRRAQNCSTNCWRDSVPGWKTDRGRIYITMTYPFEDWRFAQFENIGSLSIEFVDRSSSSDFRMTLDPKEKYQK